MSEQHAKASELEAYHRDHATDLLTLVNTACDLDDAKNTGNISALFAAHRELVQTVAAQYPRVQEIVLEGSSSLFVFLDPVEALMFALSVQKALRERIEKSGLRVPTYLSMDLAARQGSDKQGWMEGVGFYGFHLSLSEALARVGGAHEIVLSQVLFDHLRHTLKREKLKPYGPVAWIRHGFFRVQGLEQPVSMCEVRAGAEAPGALLPGLSESDRAANAEDEDIYGWRPAPNEKVPGTSCVLESLWSEIDLGEIWLAQDDSLKAKRNFTFSFRKKCVALLKQEEETLQSYRKKLGQNRNALAIYSTSLEAPPHFILTEAFEGKDLVTWAKERGGMSAVPLLVRLEILAQAASGLQGAHEARIVHAEVRPEHILVAGAGTTPKDVQVKLAHFGAAHFGKSPLAEPQLEAASPNAGAAQPSSTVAIYKAPEATTGQRPDPKWEVYSMGVLLCQTVLGDLSQSLTPERMVEIVGIFKQESLAACIVADSAKRAGGVGRLASDLRAIIKERENRPAGPGSVQRRKLLQTIAAIILFAASGVVVAVFGPKYFRRRPPPSPKSKPASRRTSDRFSPSVGDLRMEEDRSARADKDQDDEGVGITTRHRPAGATRDKRPVEEAKESFEMLFKLMILPIAVVVIIGTVAHQVHLWMQRRRRKPPEGSQE